MASKNTISRAARAAVADDQAVLAASAHLTERDRYLVRLVAEHRVLTTGQLCALGFASIITARHRLGLLVRIGVLRRFRPRRDTGSAPWHYLLGPVGAALLGAEDRAEKKWLPQVRADRQVALERSQRLAHMTGTNWFFVSLARHAREGGGELRCWLGETATSDYIYNWGYGRSSGLPCPDGLGIWAESGQEITFLLEYDTGSEHLPRLAAKLEHYAHLATDSSYERRERITLPLLFCFPSARREQSARRALQASIHAARLKIATAAFDPQETCPAGELWLPLARPGQARQVRLADLRHALAPARAAYGTPGRYTR
jgi:hypothetical protein